MFFELVSRTGLRVFALKYDLLSSGRPGFLLQVSLGRQRPRPPLLGSVRSFSPAYSILALSSMGLPEAVFQTALSISRDRPGSVGAGSSTLLGWVNVDHS